MVTIKDSLGHKRGHTKWTRMIHGQMMSMGILIGAHLRYTDNTKWYTGLNNSVLVCHVCKWNYSKFISSEAKGSIYILKK